MTRWFLLEIHLQRNHCYGYGHGHGHGHIPVTVTVTVMAMVMVTVIVTGHGHGYTSLCNGKYILNTIETFLASTFGEAFPEL